MISLGRKDFPARKNDLAQALDDAAHRFVEKPGSIVDLRARVFPYVDEITINLDGAIVDPSPPKPAVAEGETARAFETTAVTSTGRKVSVRGVPINLRMEMQDVIFDKGFDANGDALLILRKVREGQVVISASQVELEQALVRIVGAKARSYAIELEQVRLAMRARGPRSLAAEIHVQAKKFFGRAKIDIYVQFDITDEFVAKISQLNCKGDGKLGSFACSTLEPLFKSVLEKSVPLKSLPVLGALQLRDIHLAVADTVDLTVDFGEGD